MATLKMDEGEYAPWAVDLSEITVPPWDDISGGGVTLTAERTSPSPAPMTPVAGTLDAADAAGKVHGGGGLVPASWTAGSYTCTVEVTKPGVDLPLKDTFTLEIRKVAKKPPP